MFTSRAADAGTKQARLEVDLGERTTLNRARIAEEFDRMEESDCKPKKATGGGHRICND